ncbi:hypothetical protein RO3G_10456 [Rhizopus delemar RA 99-880]|uniref:Uncharacterized protein n=1 Tax=Rhizopus delemar (strain RA 99-880 / ATCC MYA-4621 / FGSC 9543 / NRRL 43880) TaxID=246409 RepID=I1CBB6_RHIO9|nr:hypothetical protein RO3G_10456 [Rhizopus delemar RA 99-880]|eukprot:EIE85746.1 hypothetical protein RO3G_10456 [Rhizopus delemar RA 99-880]
MFFNTFFVQRSTPEYANEPLANILFANEIEFDAWNANVAIHHVNWIKRIESLFVAKGDMTFHILAQ